MARRALSGCLGCLPRLILFLVLAAVLIIAMTAVFAPWGFFMGGRFHIIPYWQGGGVLNSKTGRYVVFVRFEPRPNSSKVMPHPSVGGTGYLCSPRGEIFRMNLSGAMRRGIGTDTDGEKISIGMDYWPVFSGTFMTHHRPSVGIEGKWQNPDIVGDDHGSIFRAFNPDGTVDQGHSNKPYPGDITQVILHPGSYSDFESACQASH